MIKGNWLSVVLLCAFSLGLTACGTTSPKPEPYSGPDEVGTPNASDIVGDWRVSFVNQGLESEAEYFYTFTEDGQWLSRVRSLPDSAINYEMEGTGTWQIQGQMVSVNVQEIVDVSGNNISKIMTKLIKSNMRKTSTANPYSVSQNQIIWVAENGVAIQLDRI